MLLPIQYLAVFVAVASATESLPVVMLSSSNPVGNVRILSSLELPGRAMLASGSFDDLNNTHHDVLLKFGPTKREIDIYSFLLQEKNPHVPLFFGLAKTPEGGSLMVIQRAPGRTFGQLLGRSSGSTRRALAGELADCIFEAIRSLWDLNLTHGDLHANNILVEENSKIVTLIDFELSKRHEEPVDLGDWVILDALKQPDLKPWILPRTLEYIETRNLRISNLVSSMLASS